MVTADKSPPVTLLAVRATVHLDGLPFDHVACVNPDLPTIGEWLNLGYLVALPQSQQSMCDGVELVLE